MSVHEESITIHAIDYVQHWGSENLRNILAENVRQLDNFNLTGHVHWLMMRENEAIRAELFKREHHRHLITNNTCQVFINDDNGNEIVLLDDIVHLTNIRLIKPLVLPGPNAILGLTDACIDTLRVFSAAEEEIKRALERYTTRIRNGDHQNE